MPRCSTTDSDSHSTCFRLDMIPEFDGSTDALSFIRYCKLKFEIHRPSEHLKLISIQNSFKGQALDACYLQKNKIILTDKTFEWLEE